MNAAVSRTDRVTTPSWTICTGISRFSLSRRDPPTGRLQARPARCTPPGCGSSRRRRWRAPSAPLRPRRRRPSRPTRRPRCGRCATGCGPAASSTNSALGLKPYSESRVLPSIGRADQAEHAGEVAVGGRGLGDVRLRALLGGQPRDVAVVLDERGLAREEAVVRHPGLGDGAWRTGRPPARRAPRRACGCGRWRPRRPPGARPGRSGSPRRGRRRRGRPGRRRRRRGLACGPVVMADNLLRAAPSVQGSAT